jgi:quercetin dioxygenase-like cupin family protein
MRALLAGSVLLATGAAPAPTPLPSPLEAGWQGRRVCELLFENAQMRTLRCRFPPGVGHERHFHARHWGHVIAGGTMRITTAAGTRDVTLKAGHSWWSEGIAWHEAVNIGDTTAVYLIVEPRAG